MARYVRFHPKEYKYSSPCMRVEVYTSAEAVAALRAGHSPGEKEGGLVVAGALPPAPRRGHDGLLL